jgi:hypothetical protein
MNNNVDLSNFEEGFAEVVSNLDFLPENPEMRENVLKMLISFLLANMCV